VIAVLNNDRYFTPEEYFAWEEQQLERHELIDGCVCAMSGGTKNHSAITINIGVSIKTYLRGSKCHVFNSDLKVKIFNTSNYIYPDSIYITYPCLTVEVLSSSTEAYDRGKKFEKYRRNPHLIDYVLVSSEEVVIDIYHKNDAGEWVILSYRSGDQVKLKSIDLSLPIEQFYEEIVFESVLSPSSIRDETRSDLDKLEGLLG
jgi:Uma2 family endonuclease